MASISLSTRIASPVDVVFNFASEVEKFPERIKGITKVEKLTEGPVGVGTRFRETRIMFGREATEEMEFTQFEPNRSYALGCQSCGATYRTVFRFEPDGDGTLVSVDFEARATSFFAKLMTPLTWLMKGMLKTCLQQDLDQLKAAAEAAAKAVA